MLQSLELCAGFDCLNAVRLSLASIPGSGRASVCSAIDESVVRRLGLVGEKGFELLLFFPSFFPRRVGIIFATNAGEGNLLHAQREDVRIIKNNRAPLQLPNAPVRTKDSVSFYANFHPVLCTSC